MTRIQITDYAGVEISVAMTEDIDSALVSHLRRPQGVLQEDLTFAYWRASRGATRFTAILQALNLPAEDERILQGNVAFTSDYAARVLRERPPGMGIALIHSHLGPGWQGMSHDDVIAESERLAGVVAGATDLPVLGLTWGTDGAWSARIWLRAGRRQYERRDASTVRVVGRRLRISYHPRLRPAPSTADTQVATASVWGDAAQADLVRARLGIVGLGSVGSLVNTGACRTGFQHLTHIDHDVIEPRNLDRTDGAFAADLLEKANKVEVARRAAFMTHTAATFQVTTVHNTLQSEEGYRAALDCDVIVCCVDRPWPRHILNAIAYAHLIPVVDGGILARVREGRLIHVDWRMHTVGPKHACMYCLGALRRSDVALDREGRLDDPDYIQGLSPEERDRYAGRNVYAFSMSVASHELLQLAGLLTGLERVGGTGPQTYHAYPGIMVVSDKHACDDDCDIDGMTADANDNIVR